MLAPPPNITGTLHLGHAMTISIQDMYARWYRMKGYSVNWIPGTDHAGISTQVVVEKQLQKEKNKKMGASMNWDQEYFTMDKSHSKVVEEAFIQLFNEGMIYRDTKMVNWCCELKSVISDIEVDRVELSQPTKIKLPGIKNQQTLGVMHEISYKVVDSDNSCIGNLVVGTTRPETVLGDMAIAVNSKDERYKVFVKFHGKYAVHLISGDLIPIIVDDILVNIDFGTGAVKVTPSHDIADYECALRHNLSLRQVIGLDGKVFCEIPSLSKYNGLTRWDARRQIVDHIKSIGAYIGNNIESKKAFKTSIALCSRSGDIIEPMLIPQWYLKMSNMSQNAMNLVKNKEIQILPDKFISQWNMWLENTQDWCISRQLWWGHQIPVYKVLPKSSNTVDTPSDINFKEFWVAANSEEKATEIALKKLENSYPRILSFDITISRDHDVLDTWFSSGLLPLTVFNNQSISRKSISLDNNKALSTLLETGNDILFFWVARMVMLCSHFSGVPPFSKVFLHSMIRDSMGRKMSKSLGNVIDPLSVINGTELSVLKENLNSSFLSDKELKA
ncbi:hypothetical protein BB561_003517 [Smittium simulii]|uniref:valine--tRNA ligase n=1 Tax=Smittium simulii TaxID=133385 RepID=A0A2T9YKV8_9FUNG|nr:hypothetical protein BB561_003517 [Smittium simulii]